MACQRKRFHLRGKKLTGLLLLTVTLGTLSIVSGYVAAQAQLDPRLAKAVEYLRTVAYNPSLKLCREAPRVAPNVYWIASDNLLAYKALEPFDANLSATIRSELIKIAKDYNLPHSKDGVPLSLRYDVVMRDDETLEIPPRDLTHITLQNGSYLLRYDIANGTDRFDDWRDYADLLLLVALSNHNNGDHVNALGNFTLAGNMWDSIGLRDKAYRLPYGEGQAKGSSHAYATYKLGLFLYVAGKLGISPTFEQDVVARVWSMQNQTSGGIFTHIMPDGTHGDSDTNTETTAFVILGMTSFRSQPIPEFEPTAFVMLSVTLTLSVAILRRIRQIASGEKPTRQDKSEFLVVAG